MLLLEDHFFFIEREAKVKMDKSVPVHYVIQSTPIS